MDFPLNIYFKAFELENGEHPIWLHYGLHEKFKESFEQTQWNATKFLLLNKFNMSSGRVLDVGIGLGETCFMLDSVGYNVTGLTPDQSQIDFVNIKYPNHKFNLVKQKFEKYETPELYDIILFQESAQYINIYILLQKCNDLLNSSGQILILDEIKTVEIPYFRELLKIDFKLDEEIDLTSKAAFSVPIIIETIEKWKDTIAQELDIHPIKIYLLLERLKRRDKAYKEGNYKYIFFSLIKK